MEEIRLLPQQEERVETGPVQFGDDWPGLFVRGDNCIAIAMALRIFLDDPTNQFARMQVESLVELFQEPLQRSIK